MTRFFASVKDTNAWVDYWYDHIGVNVIPHDSRNKRPIVKWKEFQHKLVPHELKEQWKKEDAFKNGIMILPGKVWHNAKNKDLYLIGVDLDNKIAIDEFCTNHNNNIKITLHELAQRVIVEQHEDDPDRAHVIFYATRPFKNKSSDIVALAHGSNSNQVPAIEVKSDGKHGVSVTPSIHKNGHYYQIIGTTEPETRDDFEEHLDNIFSKYGISYLTKTKTRNKNKIMGNGSKLTAKELINLKDGTIIPAGHNRHEALLMVMDSFLVQNRGRAENEIYELAWKWHNKFCEPLPESEVKKLWEQAKKYVAENPVEANINSERECCVSRFKVQLEGNDFYRINPADPEKFVIASKKAGRLVEMWGAEYKDKAGGMVTEYLQQKKTYLTCIPIEIVRHKRTFHFMPDEQKFTISFVDSSGEKFVLSHKTLSEIMSRLRDRALVMNDGSEYALNAIVQAFKETKTIKDTEDMNITGFFTDKDFSGNEKAEQIIASNVDIIVPDINELVSALDFLEEVKKFYQDKEGGYALLATAIVWFLFAPMNFMLKQGNYFLPWLAFYGWSNATKTTTGLIGLAIDGHHTDLKFNLGYGSINTEARLGETVSSTTFPKQINEVDLSDPSREWFTAFLKIAIENKIARSRFKKPHDTEATPVPSLTALTITSNFPLPNDPGFRRKIIDRHFPKSEMKKKEDPEAIELERFLRTELGRLKALGNFRNWYIMNNPQKILDEKRPRPLDLGYNILSEAYNLVGRPVPGWLKERIPENQLEETLQDAEVVVKAAFEKYIDEQINKAIPMWRSELDKEVQLRLPDDISGRLIKLAHSNLLPHIKALGGFHIIIRKGILNELYAHGITRDQCPNLPALAEYMDAEYRKSDGYNVVSATKAQLSKYFDEIEDLDGTDG